MAGTYYVGGALSGSITTGASAGSVTFAPGALVVSAAGLISTTEGTQALPTTGWGYISLHTASPSTTGANEVAGGSYIRAAVTWNSQSGGQVTNSNTVTVAIPASTTAAYWGVWSTSS